MAQIVQEKKKEKNYNIVNLVYNTDHCFTSKNNIAIINEKENKTGYYNI